ncbi:MAG: DUF4332 domain-containing protein [Candidatus Dormiibacterota bacterium]
MAMKTLEYLRGISPDDARRLRERGIRHSNQLLHIATLAIDRDRLSKRTGISAARLLEFAHQCALLEVSGMETYLPVVRRLGIDDMKSLKHADARVLHERIVDAVGYAGAPAPSMVEYWVSQARMIDTIEEEAGGPPAADGGPIEPRPSLAEARRIG